MSKTNKPQVIPHSNWSKIEVLYILALDLTKILLCLVSL